MNFSDVYTNADSRENRQFAVFLHAWVYKEDGSEKNIIARPSTVCTSVCLFARSLKKYGLILMKFCTVVIGAQKLRTPF